MKQCVKIINCSNDMMWYKDKIGERYEFLFMDEFDNRVVVDLANSNEDRGSILIEDCEIFEVEDDVVIRDFIEIPNELELLQNEVLDQSEYMVETDYRLLNLELGLGLEEE